MYDVKCGLSVFEVVILGVVYQYCRLCEARCGVSVVERCDAMCGVSVL